MPKMNAIDKATDVIQNMSLAGFGLSVHLFSQCFEEEDWGVAALRCLSALALGWERNADKGLPCQTGGQLTIHLHRLASQGRVLPAQERDVLEHTQLLG